MHCDEREKLKAEVARTARLFIEAGDFRKDAIAPAELETARQREREARDAYNTARENLEKHLQQHVCLP